MRERPIIVIDVNETLLNLDTLRPTFDRIFTDHAVMRLWFAGLITYSEAPTLSGVYGPGSCRTRPRSRQHLYGGLPRLGHHLRSLSQQAGLILHEGNAPLDIGPQPHYVAQDLEGARRPATRARPRRRLRSKVAFHSPPTAIAGPTKTEPHGREHA